MGGDVIRFTHVRFGEQEVSRDKLIVFPDGVPGFEQATTFALFTEPGSEPFQWLLSTMDPRLGFVLIDPVTVWTDYEPKISREDLKSLEVSSAEDIVIYAVVTLAEDPAEVTVNLSGPILVNTANRRARQLALLDDRYTTKHRIVDALQQA
ncbi:MAG: flagellar assembly protein FliW [Candidatus Latescibacteria bacterium]|jgi:flagellar assembly factor FliW|nr:flagellar assembly protein FliW [Candidatus Latescibacterota bacterium]